jgi:hypothetical protein
MRPTNFTITFLALGLTLACTGPGTDDEADDSTSESTDDTTTADDEASTSDDTTSDDTSTTADDDTTSDTSDTEDTGDPVGCDPYAQDCAEGEKCVPYSSNGGGAWDAVKCVPILGDQAPGEPCTYTDPVVATDDCDGTSWCFNVDEDTLEGTCHAFCSGTPQMPECPPMTICSTPTPGVINVCTPSCDPIGQDCEEGTGCYWYMDEFTCIPTSDDLPTGEPCGFPNDCAPGNYCIADDKLPTCDAAECCANFCDLDLGDSQCAAVPGTACVPFFEQVEAMEVPGHENVGICVLPP